MWAEAGDFVAQVGFPVAVAGYVLWRLEPTIRDLGRCVTALTIVIASSNGADYKKAFRVAGVKQNNGGGYDSEQ